VDLHLLFCAFCSSFSFVLNGSWADTDQATTSTQHTQTWCHVQIINQNNGALYNLNEPETCDPNTHHAHTHTQREFISSLTCSIWFNLHCVSKNWTPIIFKNNFNKYGTTSIISGKDNCQRVSNLCVCNLWDVIKQGISLGHLISMATIYNRQLFLSHTLSIGDVE